MGNLPEAVRVSRGEGGQRMWVRVRADAGYFAQSLASTAARLGPGVFAVAAKRVAPLWAATVRVPADAWQQASGMLGAQIAALDYAPAGWPPGTYTIVRRVWTSASEAGTGKGRRACTHGPTQLAADLGATTAGKYAYSYLRYLNPDRWARIPHAGRRREWFRDRAQVENVIRNTKYGAGLNHLLSGSHTVNTVWMWAALTAVNLTILMQELAIATYPTPVLLRRVTTLTIARTLIAVPARIVRHARAIIIGPGPTGAGLADLITRLRTHRT